MSNHPAPIATTTTASEYRPIAPSAAVAAEVAEILFKLKVVQFTPQKPIRLTSGRLSPVYIDCRMLISFPTERARIMSLMAAQVQETIGQANDVVIAGGETAGIPYAALIAAQLDQPMIYVRKQPKDFGKGKQIEGLLKSGQTAVLIEDLATDGGSKVNFLKAIRYGGGIVSDVFVIFYYNIFQSALGVMTQNRFNMHYLCSWADLLAYASREQLLPADQLASVQRYLDAPDSWTA